MNVDQTVRTVKSNRRALAAGRIPVRYGVVRAGAEDSATSLDDLVTRIAETVGLPRGEAREWLRRIEL